MTTMTAPVIKITDMCDGERGGTVRALFTAVMPSGFEIILCAFHTRLQATGLREKGARIFDAQGNLIEGDIPFAE
jgi:hypothetical protein